MNVVQLTPGTGNFHCGNCLRDQALVTALRRMGHDVTLVPLYLPMVVDGPDAAGDTPLFFGGINVYLQHKSAVFRHTPRWLDKVFDASALLRMAADKSDMTTARDLGELTVSMLRGEEGRQVKELKRLTDWLRQQPRTDVVNLSNALLIGLARTLRRELGSAVVCTLMGEDAFLDSLLEPYRTEAWNLLRERAQDVDAFVAVSRYYGDEMARRLNLPAEKVHVVPNGIDVAGYAPPEAPPDPPVLGFFARLCHGKGIDLAVDTFLELVRRDAIPNLRFAVGGSLTPSDEALVNEQKEKIEAAGLTGRVIWTANPDHAGKQAFFRSISALTVPARYGESFGMYLLEAWASGVPVVQPRSGAFVELIEQTGAGILAASNDPTALADAVSALLSDPNEALRLGRIGSEHVLRHFTVDAMAQGVLRVYESVAAPAAT